jgi:hypothetical protein
MALSMASVLAVPVMAPAISAVTGGVMITAYAGLILGPVAFSAAATVAATLGAGYLLLAGATLAGALVLRRAGHERPRAV